MGWSSNITNHSPELGPGLNFDIWLQVYQADFVILCVGRFSDVPNIPEFPPNKSPKAFRGKVIHSMDYAAMDYASAAQFVTGKTITVVGLQKSALDIAMECSAANGEYNSCIFTNISASCLVA